MNFDEVKNKIYPWVKSSLSYEEILGDKIISIDLLEKKLIADLVVFFALDRGDDFRVLRPMDIPKDYSIEVLYKLACQNLTRDITFKIVLTNYGGYGICADGNHEAGALCLDHIWEYIADRMDENFIVSAPNKDVITFVAQSQTEALIKMKELSSNSFKNGDRALTEHLFLYDIEQKKFTVYE